MLQKEPVPPLLTNKNWHLPFQRLLAKAINLICYRFSILFFRPITSPLNFKWMVKLGLAICRPTLVPQILPLLCHQQEMVVEEDSLGAMMLHRPMDKKPFLLKIITFGF